MKKLLALIVALCGMTAAMADDTNGFIEVYSADQLKEEIEKDDHARIHLAADIKLAKYGNDPYWDTFLNTFYGTIDGGYMTIDMERGKVLYGTARIYGTDYDQWDWVNRCLFSKVENAVFSNLTFMNIAITEYASNNTGVIAREAKNCVFSNVTFCNVKVKSNVDKAGTLVGYAEGCRFFAVSVQNSEVETDGKRAGGLVGQSKDCGYQMCITNPATNVYSDGTAFDGAYVGGLVGHSLNDVFAYCVNTGMVGANDHYAGGLVGMSEYSQFIACQNCGPVAHYDQETFERDAENHYLTISKMTYDDAKVLPLVVGSLGESVTVGDKPVTADVVCSMVSELCRESLNSFTQSMSGGLLGKMYAMNLCPLNASDPAQALTFGQHVPVAADGTVAIDPSTETLCEALWSLSAVFSNGFCASMTAYNTLEHDNVGGISGCAKGGLYEGCANYGSFACEDENCGGIVGLGQGVTICNCLNLAASTDYDVVSTTAGILGKAEPDESKGYKRCLVTNCLSTWDFHLVGDSKYADGMNPASGNNYRLTGGKSAGVVCEMQVSEQQIGSGIVAMWLNQGIENRSEGFKPWRQTLAQQEAALTDAHPVLDINHCEVTIDDLPHEVIERPDQLVAFAARVNAGDQFACAVLANDLDMSPVDNFTPIGLNESYAQFRGIFDGRGHTISNLKVSRSKEAGLFGGVHAHAQISNVIVGEGSEITSSGDEGAGGIVGRVCPNGWQWGNVVIENCGSLAEVKANNHGGGIVGRAMIDYDYIQVFVDNCFNMGTITATQGNSGLLCGYMRNAAVVSNCWSAGQLLSGTQGVKPFDDTNKEPEFFVGYLDELNIKDCYAIDPAVTVQGADGDTKQEGVRNTPTEWAASGWLTFYLNKEVTDGTQMWFQKLGEGGDPYPVRTPALDGSNIVYRWVRDDYYDGGGFGNVTLEEMTDYILGIKNAYYSQFDLNQDRKHTVEDLVPFIGAVNKLKERFSVAE